MDYEFLKGYVKETKIDKIHKELFMETTEYKYYLLGMSQGLSIIYDLLDKCKDKNYSYTCEELMYVIDGCAKENEKIADYYNRLKKKTK